MTEKQVEREIKEIRAALQSATVALEVIQGAILKNLDEEERKRMIDAMKELSIITQPGGIRGYPR
jgi:hypothetical protein